MPTPSCLFIYLFIIVCQCWRGWGLGLPTTSTAFVTSPPVLNKVRVECLCGLKSVRASGREEDLRQVSTELAQDNLPLREMTHRGSRAFSACTAYYLLP